MPERDTRVGEFFTDAAWIAMLVFIDESGDAGFKIDHGATPVFALAMVLFATAEDARKTERTNRDAQDSLHVKPEFRFSKLSDGRRDGFFRAIVKCPFRVRAVVVLKEMIFSPRLRANKEAFYEYFIKQMLIHNDGSIQDARVIIDGSGEREFRRQLAAALRRRLGRGIIKDISFGDSRRGVLLQLADMAAGAVARSYRPDRDHNDRWRSMLAPKIDDVWEFR